MKILKVGISGSTNYGTGFMTSMYKSSDMPLLDVYTVELTKREHLDKANKGHAECCHFEDASVFALEGMCRSVTAAHIFNNKDFCEAAGKLFKFKALPSGTMVSIFSCAAKGITRFTACGQEIRVPKFDLAFVHFNKICRNGNVPMNQVFAAGAIDLAYAAKKVIVSCDEIVDDRFGTLSAIPLSAVTSIFYTRHLCGVTAHYINKDKIINLGAGKPIKDFNTGVSYSGEGEKVFFESGIYGADPKGTIAKEPWCIDAKGDKTPLGAGGCYIGFENAFKLIDSGHVDETHLGCLEISPKMDFALHDMGNGAPGPGGAIDLICHAEKVIVHTKRTFKDGTKIVDNITLPKTGRADKLVVEGE